MLVGNKYYIDKLLIVSNTRYYKWFTMGGGGHIKLTPPKYVVIPMLGVGLFIKNLLNDVHAQRVMKHLKHKNLWKKKKICMY